MNIPRLILILIASAAMALAAEPRQAVRIVYDDGSVQEIAPPTSQPTTQPLPAEPRTRSAIGFNLSVPNTYHPSDYFIDAMKSANPFGTFERPEDKAAPKDQLGWPTVGKFGVVVMVDREPAEIAGDYRLIASGRTTPSVINSGGTQVLDIAYNAAADQTTAIVRVRDSRALWLRFDGAMPATGPLKVKLLRPGYTSDDGIFTGAFLALLNPEQGKPSGLRFMDWGATNDSTVTSWATRRPLEAATWSGEVPIEIQIALCNRLKLDGWFCIPHAATDDYIQKFRELIEQTLDPELEAIAEYSNEVWNWMFSQTRWVFDEAQKRVAAGGSDAEKLTMGGTETISGYFHQLLIAEQTVRIKRLLGDRFTIVLGAHYGYGRKMKEVGWWSVRQARYIRRWYGEEAMPDVLAIAPYSSVGSGPTTRPYSMEEYIIAAADSASATASDRFKIFGTVAADMNAELWAYEGNRHDPKTLGDGPVLAERDMRMQGITDRYLNNFFDNGGRRFFWFQFITRHDRDYRWGATWSVYEPHSPTLRAIRLQATSRPYEGGGE